jgi:hypothetical protein
MGKTVAFDPDKLKGANFSADEIGRNADAKRITEVLVGEHLDYEYADVDDEDSDYDHLENGIDMITATTKVKAGDWATATLRIAQIRNYRADHELKAKGDDSDFIEPNRLVDYSTPPKPCTDFTVQTTRRRIVSKEYRAKGLRLLAIEGELKRANDPCQKGKLLQEAKSILDHGKWIPWLEKVGIPTTTADRLRNITKS